MDHLANPTGRAAVPDGSGGIRFVASTEAPQNVPWGRYEYATNRGLPCIAYGPQSPPGATAIEWRADDLTARQICGVITRDTGPAPPIAARRAPPPLDRLAAYRLHKAQLAQKAARLAPAARGRLPATDLQRQAGHGGLLTVHGGTSTPPAADTWAASHRRVFGPASDTNAILETVAQQHGCQRRGVGDV